MSLFAFGNIGVGMNDFAPECSHPPPPYGCPPPYGYPPPPPPGYGPPPPYGCYGPPPPPYGRHCHGPRHHGWNRCHY